MKEIYIDGAKVPTQFSRDIVLRMFGEDERGFSDWVKKYNSLRKTRGIGNKVRQEPTSEDYELATRYKNGEKVSALSKYTGKTTSSIYSAIERAAVWQYLKK